MRHTLRQRLLALSLEQRDVWDACIFKHIKESLVPPPHTIIAIYSPMALEVNCMGLAELWAEQGCRLCLPTIVEKDQPLKFRAFELSDPLQKGLCGPLEPLPGKEFVTPDWIVAPMLGFGSDLTRLGMGGGYFDRTLAQMKGVKTIGLAYELQYCADLPHEPHDIAFDCIVTEKQIHQRS